MPDRLLVDLDHGGLATVGVEPDGGLYERVSRAPLTWPLDGEALEDLRWYLEDYLRAPFGVWEERGPAVRARLAGWGDQVFGSVFGTGPARFAYERARDRGLELVFRSADPGLLGLPWELMRDGAGPVALAAGGVSRSLPVAGGAGTLDVPGGRLRVLMVISRPAGIEDVGYQMVARPLLERLEAVRGEVDLTVLRPPTFDALKETLASTASGEPFHMAHFDGHGVMPDRSTGGAIIGGRPATMTSPGEGVLVFEQPGGGSDHVTASRVAAVLAEGKVPVVVLNACQSGAVGKQLEASVSTALLKAGCAAVVAMAYSVYAVAAAEFMAALYESLFAGASVGQAVTAGRKRLFEHDGRPSPKGDMPLADWLVPVHYLRKEVRFPQARTTRPAAAPSLDAALDEIRATAGPPEAEQDPLAAVGGLFVGRDDLFYQLESAARLQHVVVLTGPGGTGKTELAKGFARWWRDTGGVDDPRLVVWHSFEPGLASFGLDGVITGLGLPVFGAGFARLEAPERLAQVKRLLVRLRVLLVWDNFETVREMPDPTGATPPLDPEGCAELKGFLEWVRDHSQSVVIITSRAREGWLGQVRRIGVGGLNRAEAAQYASHLLAPYPAAQARRERRSFGELLEWLDGHPLAMRLTLPGLDTTGPDALLAALRGTTPLPAADDLDAARTTSLPASITYSFVHLKEKTGRLLPAVCLLHSVADVNVLAAFSRVSGCPARFGTASPDDWEMALEDAAQVGLLTPLGGAMYQLHPALPAYLAGLWRAEEPEAYDALRDAATRALTAACADFGTWLNGQIKSGNAGLAYSVIELQRRTLGAMLGWALDHQLWDQAQEIAQPLNHYWNARGLDLEATAWADWIEATTGNPDGSPPALDSPAGALWLFMTTAQANRHQGAARLDDAERTYRRILDMIPSQPASAERRSQIAIVTHNLGVVARDRGRLDEAAERYRTSLAIFEELGERAHVAVSYEQLGVVAQEQGRLEEAEDWHRRSLSIKEELGDRPGVAESYYDLGGLAHGQGRLERVEEWGGRALAIFEELGDQPGMAKSCRLLGVVAQGQGRLDEAEDWYRRSLAIVEELEDRPGVAGSYYQLGAVARDRGRLDEAEDWYRRSIAIFEDLGNRPHLAASYLKLGVVLQEQGGLDEAEDWYRKSLAIRQKLGDRPGIAASYGQLGLLAEQRGHAGQALAWTIRCVSLFAEFPHPVTGPGPGHLARLTRQLGMPALEEAWRQVTGNPVPQAVRSYITSRRDEEPEASHDRPGRRRGPLRRRDPRP